MTFHTWWLLIPNRGSLSLSLSPLFIVATVNVTLFNVSHTPFSERRLLHLLMPIFPTLTLGFDGINVRNSFIIPFKCVHLHVVDVFLFSQWIAVWFHALELYTCTLLFRIKCYLNQAWTFFTAHMLQHDGFFPPLNRQQKLRH